MADGYIALQGSEHRLVENLGNQSGFLEHHDAVAIAHRDSGAFLTAVLQSEESKVGELGYFLAWGPDSENSAFFTGFCFVEDAGMYVMQVLNGHGAHFSA
ncbi:hypothetical protein GCM10028828_16060 [Corynebacterium tapiri]